MTTAETYQLVPFADDPLARLAERLLEEHRAKLPRLDHVVVLLPETGAASRLRTQLLQNAAEMGFDALLGPHITTLNDWLNSQPAATTNEVVNDYERELILVEALREHRGLFGEGNIWALAGSLLKLFDELTLNHVSLPKDLSEFTARIARGYGLQEVHPPPMDHEARLVHTLWHAWHQQLHARQLIDANTRYLLQLAHSLRQTHTHAIYMAGTPLLCQAEQQWLERMLKEERLTLLLHGEVGEEPPRTYHPQTALHRLIKALHIPVLQNKTGGAINQLFDNLYSADGNSGSLHDRARQFSDKFQKSPIAGRIKLFHANGDEQEARAVELQVRRWLLDGKRQIGIVSENRRLARRVRALLERAGIILHDTSGWALSTTSAAATLEHWLQCVEEDFGHQPMLDLLKSPFIFTAEDHDTHLNNVYRLEQDIVLHENIGSGLERYLRQTRYRQHRLPQEMAAGLNGVIALLERLQDTASPLQPLLTGQHQALRYLDTLLESLEPLGLAEGLAADAAGERLLDVLQQMRTAVQRDGYTMEWLEFRGWLGAALEQSHFRPATQGSPVTLMGLGQSQLHRFDALIIAGMEREYLPGAPASSPFFNDAVRRELLLPQADEQLALRFFHYRRLLETTDTLLLTLRHSQDGEDILPSPWLESLRSFHLLAYGSAMEDEELGQLLASDKAQVVDRTATLPGITQSPSPAIEAALLPARYSASAYQQLMNCPYQFFTARGLRLAPPEAIREALEKSDYGERVHRILQAFHGDVPGLPGPFAKKIDASNRDRAQQMLEAISHTVFAEDLEDSFFHRGWLQRWLEKIPAYLDWQIAREEAGRVDTVEADLRTEGFSHNLELQGRLDRIDRQHEALAVVDYKTGGIASEEEVLNGEAIQLPFYALLARHFQLPVSQVEYLALDIDKPGSKVILREDELLELCDAVGERLKTVQSEMADAKGLPAWGDDITCSYCNMEGVCRRSSWVNDEQESPAVIS